MYKKIINKYLRIYYPISEIGKIGCIMIDDGTTGTV